MLLTLTAAMALAAGIVTAYRPWWGLFFIAVFLPMDYPVSLGLTVYSNEFVLTGVLAGYLCHVLWTKVWKQLSWHTILYSMLFILALVLSATQALSISAVFKQTVRWLQLILVLFYTSNALRTEEELNYVVRSLIWMGGLTALFGILQSLVGPESVFNYHHSVMMQTSSGGLRAYSTFGHPNQFAGFLMCVLPLSVPAWRCAKKGWARTSILAAGLAMGLALVLTYTRSAWISFFIAGMVWVYVRAPKKIFYGLLAIGVVSVLLLRGYTLLFPVKTPALAQRVISISQPGQEDSVHFRTECLRIGGRMWLQHPWVGFGAGNYAENIRQFYPENYYAWEAVSKHIHNLYLQIAIETGTLGLLGFLVFIGYPLITLARAWYSVRGEPRAFWLEAVLAGALAYVLANWFDVLTIYARGIYSGMILGVGLAYVRHMLPTAPDTRCGSAL